MKILLLVICLGAAPWSLAHEAPDMTCGEPIRPSDDQNDLLWQAFLNEIDAFRDCVTRQMKWHQQAAQNHQAGARDAVEAWNAFVRDKLNAPQDFPWPPAPPE